MKIGLGSRDIIRGIKDGGQALLTELDRLVLRIRTSFHVQHKFDDTHGDVTADSIAVSGNASVGGTLTVTGAVSLTGDLTVGDDLTVTDDALIGGDLTVSSLTSGRVVVAGAAGILTGDTDLTFATDTLSATKVAISSLTATRVPFAGASGLLVDDADLTFATDTLSATKVAISSLTSGRVPIASAAGLLVDDADLTFSGDTLTATKLHVGDDADVDGDFDVALTTALHGVTTHYTHVIGNGSAFPNVGSTTLSEKFGQVYLGTAKDLFPDDDAYGVFDRFVNWGFTPDEHWGQNADELTWTGYASYTGFATPSIIATTRSAYTIANAGATKFFRYRSAATSDHIWLRARCAITYICSGGLMIDDGTGNADGNGADNFYRCYITQAAIAGAMTVVEQYRTGGGAVTTNVGATISYGEFIGLGLRTTGTRWTNWTAAPFTFGESQQAVLFTTGSAAFTWTPARVGLYGVFVASDGGRKAVYDWYDEATA